MQRRARCFGLSNVNTVAVATKLAHPNVASRHVHLSRADWTMQWPSLLRVKGGSLTPPANVSLRIATGNDCSNRLLDPEHRTFLGEASSSPMCQKRSFSRELRRLLPVTLDVSRQSVHATNQKQNHAITLALVTVEMI